MYTVYVEYFKNLQLGKKHILMQISNAGKEISWTNSPRHIKAKIRSERQHTRENQQHETKRTQYDKAISCIKIKYNLIIYKQYYHKLTFACMETSLISSRKYRIKVSMVRHVFLLSDVTRDLYWGCCLTTNQSGKRSRKSFQKVYKVK